MTLCLEHLGPQSGCEFLSPTFLALIMGSRPVPMGQFSEDPILCSVLRSWPAYDIDSKHLF